MNKFFKSVIAISISSAISFSTVYAATYKVIDKGLSNTHKFTSAKAQNSNSVMAITGSQRFNFPIQFDLLTDNDFIAIQRLALAGFQQDAVLDNIEDIDALKAGNPTANDFAWVVKYLQNTTKNSRLHQKLGENNLLLNDGNNINEIIIFDQALDNGELSRSTDEFVYGLTDENWVFGRASAPYFPADFTDSNDETKKYWFRDFSTRAFISLDNGTTVKEIIPPESRFGGNSAILDINDNRVGVGYVSTSIIQSVLDNIADETGGCADPNVLKDIPLEECIIQAQQGQQDGIYSLEATKFTFDDQGNVITSESLGNLITPHVDDTRVLQSYAQAINNNGVVVGFAHGWTAGEVADPSTNQNKSLYAVIFKEGKAISLTKDQGQEFNSRAFDINDAGIAVGYATKFINSEQRTKFYYVDTNNSDLTMVYPEDFFKGSASIARAINEQGFIVGEGEIEIHNDNIQNGQTVNPRRRHGFLYDINTETFTDLNDFLACNGNYTIVQAYGINEANEISATAVVKVNRRDSFGGLVKDADGNQLTEDVVRSVILQPIGGKIEDCTKVEEKIKRKGASFGWLSLFLLPLVTIRRYKK
ncbi:MAG: hypothetical protein COB35_02865 [Gammaproteobacteria bacterium]|nr:MAG: hypothetical protein COB35_02865 [Gammaproteobacteria bacterium]